MFDCPMDEIDEIYSEVLVPPNNLQRANALAPIHSRDMLGQKAMIFENVPKEELKNLGELHAPSVADLFVAKMHR